MAVFKQSICAVFVAIFMTSCCSSSTRGDIAQKNHELAIKAEDACTETLLNVMQSVCLIHEQAIGQPVYGDNPRLPISVHVNQEIFVPIHNLREYELLVYFVYDMYRINVPSMEYHDYCFSVLLDCVHAIAKYDDGDAERILIDLRSRTDGMLTMEINMALDSRKHDNKRNYTDPR